jgi:hypothetical protein
MVENRRAGLEITLRLACKVGLEVDFGVKTKREKRAVERNLGTTGLIH